MLLAQRIARDPLYLSIQHISIPTQRDSFLLLIYLPPNVESTGFLISSSMTLTMAILSGLCSVTSSLVIQPTFSKHALFSMSFHSIPKSGDCIIFG